MEHILYRAKSVITSEWVYGVPHHNYIIKEESPIIMNTVDQYKLAYIIHPDNVVRIKLKTLSQSTGLKDKNDKYIFAGDVVRYIYKPGENLWNYDYTGLISWRGTGFYIQPLADKGGLEAWLVSVPGAYMPECKKLFEVIGDIYDDNGNSLNIKSNIKESIL